MSLLDFLLLPFERAAIFVSRRWAAAARLRGAVAGQWRRTCRAPMEWLTLYALALVGLGIFLIDEPLALLLKSTVSGEVEGFLATVTELGLAGWWLIPSAVLCLCILLARRVAISPAARDRLTRAAWAPGFVFLSVASSGLLGNLLKVLIGRSRPALLFDAGTATFVPFSFGWAMNSFPSGHTQAICAAMTALTLLYPRHALAFLTLAVLVACSRFMLTVHYFSDVVFGAWLGVFCTLALARLLALRGVEIGPAAGERRW